MKSRSSAANISVFWEKFSLFSFVVLSWLLFVVFLEVSRYFICSSLPSFTLSKLQLTRFWIPQLAIAGGFVIDLTKFSDPSIVANVANFGGQDLTAIFPTFTLLGQVPDSNNYADPDIQQCVPNSASASNWLKTRLSDPGYSNDKSKLLSCPLPNGSPGLCFYTAENRLQLFAAGIGNFAYTRQEVAMNKNVAASNALVIVGNHVYDVGRYLNISTLPDRTVNLTSTVFAADVTLTLLNNVGGDATGPLQALADGPQAIKCLEKLFYAGVVEQVPWQGCQLINPVSHILAALVLGVLFLKSLSGFVASIFSSCQTSLPDVSAETDLLVVMSCFAEPEEILRQCIQSVAESKYDRKVLIVVCDGNNIIKDGNIETHQAILDILGYCGGEQRPRSYQALGNSYRICNLAKVYRGFYEYKPGKRLPYIVLNKMGTIYELVRPGNRGKRDNQMLVLSFLLKCAQRDAKISPLEYELSCMFEDLNINPRSFEQALMLDADTVLNENCMKLLLRKMDSDSKLVVVSGQSTVANEFQSFATILYTYLFYLRNHLSVQFDSLFGGVYYVPGNCVMYRLRYSDGSPCLLNPGTLQELFQPGAVPSGLHNRNCLLMGEDRFNTILLKRSQKDWRFAYLSSAISKTYLPTSSVSMLGTERRRWNGLFHLRWEAILTPAFATWTRIWVFFDLASMMLLPVCTSYVYVEAIRFATNRVMLSYFFVTAAVLGLIALNMILLLLQLKPTFVVHTVVFTTIGIPLFFIIMPIISFWESDNFLWSDAFPAENEQRSREHGLIAEVADPAILEHMRAPFYTISQWKSGDSEVMERMGIADDAPFRWQTRAGNIEGTNSVGKGFAPNDTPMFRSRGLVNPTPGTVPPTVIVDYQGPDSGNFTSKGFTEFKNNNLPPPLPQTYQTEASVLQNRNSMYSLAPTETEYAMNRPESVLSTYQPVSYLQNVRPIGTGTVPVEESPVPQPRQNTLPPSDRMNGSPKFYTRPTNFDEGKSRPFPRSSERSSSYQVSDPSGKHTTILDPMRAVSMARSDYWSDYSASGDDHASRRSVTSRTTTAASFYGHLREEELAKLAGGVTKDEIQEEIRFLLQDADLNIVTQREVKDHLYTQFGEAVDFYHEYVNVCIEEFTLEKLALL